VAKTLGREALAPGYAGGANYLIQFLKQGIGTTTVLAVAGEDLIAGLAETAHGLTGSRQRITDKRNSALARFSL